MIFCKKTRPKNISSICNIRILKYDKNEPPCPNWRGKGAQKSPKVWPFALGKLCLVSDEAIIYFFRIWERGWDCGKWAVLGDCLWKFCANFIVGGQAGGSGYVAVYYTLISRIFARAWAKLHLHISVYRTCRETTTSFKYGAAVGGNFFLFNQQIFLCHSTSLSSIGVVVFVIVGPDEQM